MQLLVHVQLIIQKFYQKLSLGDEDFFYGPEDIELSYRLKKIGKLFVNQKAIAFHKIATSSSITGVKNRTFQSTFGFLKLIEKIGTKSDKLIGYLYFILRLIYYKFTKQKEYYDGYSFALKKFFLKKKLNFYFLTRDMSSTIISKLIFRKKLNNLSNLLQ